MNITPRQIEIVQASFDKVAPIADVAADLFYARLFELDPSLRKLFSGNMKKQGAMLMSMLGSAVRGLSNPNALLPVLTMLGRRHAGYGVVDAHYTTVAQALLWTLEQGLGEEFTPEVRNAWVAAYTLVATVMQQGAREVELKIPTAA
jgi:hemoglobin-like flavoprotein